MKTENVCQKLWARNCLHCGRFWWYVFRSFTASFEETVVETGEREEGELPCKALHTTALHSTALRCIALHCTVLHCTALHCTALNCIALKPTGLYCTQLDGNLAWHVEAELGTENRALRYTALHSNPNCTTLHYTALQYTALQCTTMHCTVLLHCTVHFTALHSTQVCTAHCPPDGDVKRSPASSSRLIRTYDFLVCVTRRPD